MARISHTACPQASSGERGAAGSVRAPPPWRDRPPPPPPPPRKTPPDFHISFAFRAARGAEKEALIRALRLNEHRDRLSHLDRQSLGLGAEDCLDHLDSKDEMPFLVIEETATTGMYGPWKGASSKLFKGLASLGIHGKDADAGGSFGYGKAGLIRGSAPRIVIAYTCFEEREDDPGVTRRLLGVTYWDAHRLEDQDYTGMARWDTDTADPRPFENEEADAIAGELGLKRRDPADEEDRGSSFLILEPTVRPEDLETAIGRSWWPALEDPSQPFQVTVQFPDGERRAPRPRRDPSLDSFVKAYREATTDAKRVGRIPDLYKGEIGETRRTFGNLVLLTAPDDWSFPSETTSRDESLVALMRSPRMVVEYLPLGFREETPIVRGVFVADERVNSFLRETEPFGHDAWDPRGDGSPEARRLAETILRRIKERVRQVRKKLAPPPPKPEFVTLPEFDRIMRRILGGTGRKQPLAAPKRFVRLDRIRSEPQVAGPGLIRTEGTARFSLSENFPASHAGARVAVQVRFVILEDGQARATNQVPVTLVPPEDFEMDGATTHRITGWLARGAERRLSFRTEPYGDDWTGRLYLEAEFLSEDS